MIVQNVKILIPVPDLDIADEFYGNAMGFTLKDDVFMLPGYGNIELLFQRAPEEFSDSNGKNSNEIRFPLFRYSVDRNFLSYCNERLSKGVRFEIIGTHPGGYAGRIIDPFGNTFEVECDSFDEDDSSIDPNEWSCFKRF